MADITYNKINFENEPSHNTPLSAENLNKMDTAIYDLVTKSNSLVPNPVSAPTEGLEKLEYDGTVYEVKGGHKILNDSGSILTQKDEMRFGGVYTHNASTITEVDIVREFSTVAEIEALTGEAQKGFQAIINGNSYEPFKATDIGFNKTGTSFTSDDVDGVLREVDSNIDDVNSKTEPTTLSIAVEPNNGYVSNFSLSTSIKKINKLLIANLVFYASGSASADWVKIGTITGWSSSIEGYAQIVGQLNTYSEVTIRIATNGIVYLYTPMALSGANYRCQILGIG